MTTTSHAQKAPKGARLRKTSASQQIHDALRTRIINLELAPGEGLSRIEIAEYYGVSQTPVRDAMMRLEEEGLLVIFPQSKTEVSRIDLDHAKETQFLRLSLEIEVARQLILAKDPALLTSAKIALTEQVAAQQADDLSLFSATDRRFHRELFEAANVSPLWDLVTERSGHIDRLRKLNLPDPGKVSDILAYHNRIIAAIAEGDLHKATSEIRGHLSGTLASVETIRQRHPEYF